MEKISIKLTRKEWIGLTAIVLRESNQVKLIEDRYFKAMLEPLLREVYKKLHNKLHSLKEAKNALILSIPEAASFNLVFADEDYCAPDTYANAILTSIISQIDKRLI